jgi:hypothetical protein
MRSRNATSAYVVGIIVISIFSGMQTMFADAKDGFFGGGDGSAGNPYIIEDVWDLQNMSSNRTAHYALGNDIDASATRTWNSGAGFEPVYAFTGTLDGRNHTITGLYIHRGNTDGVGLFASVGFDALVRDVKLADVNVTGYTDVGGLAGANEVGTIYNCHATGTVTNSWNGAGGLVGTNGGTLDRSHFTGLVKGKYSTGGLVGSLTAGVVNNSYFEGTVIGSGDAGGLLASGFLRGRVINSHYNIDRVTINGGPNVTIGGIFDAQYQDWFSSGLALDISDYRATLAPSGSWFEVGSVQGLRNLLGFAGVEGLKFRLAADLDISSAPGLFVPYLAAEFDGANHTISGLSINSPLTDCAGMFGFSAKGTIRNLGVACSSVVGRTRAGCLLGYNYFGTVWDSWASGNVESHAYTGVLVGYNDRGTVSRCTSSGCATSSGNYAGGLAGENDRGTVSDSHSTASATSAAIVGGLIGGNTGTVSNSSATGDVSGFERIGGLIGYQFSGMTANSFSSGDVAGYESIGGLIGRAYGMVSDSFAWGNVTGTNYVGGLIGDGFFNMSDSYAAGTVVGTIVGGLVGINEYIVSDCFWDAQTSGQVTSPGGTGKTTSEMMTRSTFTSAGWDFTSIWFMIEDVTYPLLRWQDMEPPTADAGSDQTVEIGTRVSFDGDGSSDDVGIADYTWMFMDGAPVTLSGPHPFYKFDDPGVYIVMLNVTDAVGKWAKDEMIVTVKDLTRPWFGEDLSAIEATTGDVFVFKTDVTDNIGIDVVNVTYWLDGIPPVNKSMWGKTLFGNGNGAYVYDNFSLPTNYLGGLYYYFVAFDETGNWNKTIVKRVNVTDNDRPEITQDLSDRTGYYGKEFTFRADVRDNIGISAVTISYWYRSEIPIKAVMVGHDLSGSGNGTYVFRLLIPNTQATYFNYFIEVMDVRGNSNTTGYSLKPIWDDEAPSFVKDNTPSEAFKGLDLTFDVEVLDNMDYSIAYVVYWYEGQGPYNESMRFAETYHFTIEVPRNAPGSLHYLFKAKDFSDNWNSTLERSITLINEAPQISAVPQWNITEHAATTLDLGPYISDRNDPLSKLVLTTDDPNITVAGLALHALFKDWVLSYVLEVSVSDGEDTSYYNITIEVVNVNDPPSVPVILSPVNGTSIRTGRSITFDASVYDPDLKAGGHVQITWSSDREGQLRQYNETTAAPFHLSNLSVGHHLITVTVSDDEYERSATVDVNIKADDTGFKVNEMGIVIIIVLIIILLVLISVMVIKRKIK